MRQEYLGNGYVRVTLKIKGQKYLFVCQQDKVVETASQLLRGDM